MSNSSSYDPPGSNVPGIRGSRPSPGGRSITIEKMILLQALFCLALQDGARELVEKLRSDTIAERETAMRRLRELGKEAAPVLEKAAKDPDAEVARRAGFLLRCLALQDSLSPALRKAVPGIEDLLAAGRTRAWTEAFLRAAGIEIG